MENQQINPTFLQIKESYPKSYYEIERYLRASYDDALAPVNVELDAEEDMINVYEMMPDGSEEKYIFLNRDLYEFFDSYGIKISIFTINLGDKKGLFTWSIDNFPDAASMSRGFDSRINAEYWAFLDAAKMLDLLIEGKI